VSRSWWKGRVLQKARQRRKLTQDALAKRVGVHQVTIARLESGSRQPSMDMLHRLAKELKVKLKDLLQ
jgi:transcriptional regulator with XRE-family HTH domain